MQSTFSGLLLRTRPRFVTQDHLALLAEFIRFGTVGVAGLVVDTLTVYGCRGFLGIYAAGMLSYAVSATVTWGLNRAWTFRGKGSGPAHHQWARFLVANLLGFVLNRGTFVLMVTFVPLAASQPVLATAAGAIAGMFVNFGLSRRFVFR